MVVAEEEDHRILDTKEYDRLHHTWPSGGKLIGIDRYIVAELIRRKHGTRAHLLLLSEKPWIQAITLADAHIAEAVGLLCESHSLERSTIEDPKRFPTDDHLLGEWG